MRQVTTHPVNAGECEVRVDGELHSVEPSPSHASKVARRLRRDLRGPANAERTGDHPDAPTAEVATAEAPAPGETDSPTLSPDDVGDDATVTAAFDVLDGTIGDLRAELDQGLHDSHLDELLAAEVDDKDRVGAKDAIEARIEEAG